MGTGIFIRILKIFYFFEIKKKVERNNRKELKFAVNIWIKYTLVFVESISSDFIISYI